MKKIFILLLITILCSSSGNLCLAENADTAENSVTSLSAVIKVMSAKIGPDGGIIKVEKECPIKGLEINIPAGAYKNEKNFNISYRLVPANQYEGKAIPYSPLIIINNGGEYADKIIKVKIPVKLPEGVFAMAGYANPNTLDITDMLPPVETQKDCLISITRHFQNPIIVTGTTMK